MLEKLLWLCQGSEYGWPCLLIMVASSVIILEFLSAPELEHKNNES